MSIVDYPDGVRSVDTIEDSGPFISLAREIDLDDLMLALAHQFGDFAEYGWSDDPTGLPGYDSEATVGWFRKQPCACGGDHRWDLALVDREKPTGRQAYGAFLGVWIG